MELLLATAVKWWDRHDPTDEKRLLGWYKKIVQRHGIDGITLRSDGFPINAIDMLFFFGINGPHNPLTAVVHNELFHYERLFLHYKTLMDRYNSKHFALVKAIKEQNQVLPTAGLLESLFNNNPKLHHRFIVDDFQETLRTFLGFDRLVLTETNIQQRSWFVERIRPIPKPSQLYKVEWTGGLIEYCRAIDRLHALELDIQAFNKTLLPGLKIKGNPGIYLQYTEPYYSRYNGQLFKLLESGVHQLKMAMIRFMRHAIDPTTNILVGETSNY